MNARPLESKTHKFWVIISSGANEVEVGFSDPYAAVAQGEFADKLGLTYALRYASEEAHLRLSDALGVGQTRFT
jgi:hypothetical protein